MKKILIILAVVLTNVFSVVATPINNFKISDEVISNSIGSDKTFKSFNDSIMIHDNMNFTPVYRFLQLKNDQYEEFYKIHRNVANSLDYLENKKENGTQVFNNNMSMNLRNSYYILDKDQYYMYLRVLNATMMNRDLLKYLQ